MCWLLAICANILIQMSLLQAASAEDSAPVAISFHALRDVPISASIDTICCQTTAFQFPDELTTTIRTHYGESSLWLKLENVGDAGLIQLGPVLDDVTLYSRSGELMPWNEVHTGDQIANSRKLFPSPFMTLPLDEGIDRDQIYVRIVQPAVVTISATAWQLPAFMEMQNRDQVLKTFLSGFIFAIIIYNIVISFVVRDATFIFNALCIFSLLFLSLYLSGYGTLYIWGGLVGWSNYIFSLSIYCGVLFGSIFFWLFLRSEPVMPDKTMLLFVAPAIATIGGLAGFFFPYWVVQLCMLACAALLFVTMLFLTTSGIIRGDTKAKILLFPIAFAMAPGIGMVALDRIYGVKLVDFGNNGLEITLCAEAVLFSLALASRIRLAEKSARELQKSMLVLRADSASKAMQALDEERRRLANELHDGVGQSFLFIVGSLKKLKADGQSAVWLPKISEIIQSASYALGDLRRISRDMHPAAIEHLGLKKAVEDLLQRFENANNICTERQLDFCDAALDRDAQLHVYRILQECMANVSRHSSAELCTVSITSEKDRLQIVVEDDGVGINTDTSEIFSPPGLGLVSIDERVRAIGGKWSYENGPMGGLRTKFAIPKTLQTS